MSLRVWLPLTKDLRNQGLDDVTVTNNGATFNSAGKLGGCYYFNRSSSNYLKIDNPITTSANGVSMAFWVKIPSNASGNNQIIHIGNGAGWNNNRCTCFIYQGTSSLVFSCSDGQGQGTANSTQYNCKSSIITLNSWIHVVCTYSTGKMKIYLNGILDKDYTTTIVPSFANTSYIGVGAAPNAGEPATVYINDVRIYDHCLSQMEVKEISKGLVLHYPLNRQGWGQDNILLNTGFQSRYTQSTGWDTTKNGTQLANSWGGYNSGVGNQATVYHAHLKEFNGEWVYEYIKTANESWLGISQGGLQSKLTAGKKYTFSWEQYSVSGSNYNHGGLYYYKTGASSASFHLGSFSGTGGITGQWKKFSYTFTAPSDADYSKNMSWYIYGMNGGNGTLYMRHPKLEEGESATPWCPNPSDALATTMGLNSTTEYDCSGFCNNGTISGALTISNDTPKYAVSTTINSSKIQCMTNPITGDDPIFSIGFWFKLKSNISYIAYADLVSFSSSSYSNQPFRLEICGNPVGNDIYWFRGPSGNTGGFKINTSNLVRDTWYHTMLVSEGNKQYSYYINGIKTGTYNGSANSWIPTNIFSIGDGQAGAFDISDVRIYATALSADDVKSLYQNSAYIDSSGNVYGTIHES